MGIGKDHTIFSLIDGLVKFEKFGPDRKKVKLKPKTLCSDILDTYRFIMTCVMAF